MERGIVRVGLPILVAGMITFGPGIYFVGSYGISHPGSLLLFGGFIIIFGLLTLVAGGALRFVGALLLVVGIIGTVFGVVGASALLPGISLGTTLWYVLGLGPLWGPVTIAMGLISLDISQGNFGALRGEDRRVVRVGGLAGLLTGVLAIVAFSLLYSVLGGQSQSATVAAIGLLLASVILEVALFLVLYRAVRGTSPASALVGTVVGVLGLVVLAIVIAIVLFPALHTAILSDTIFYYSGTWFMLYGGGWVLVSIGMVALGVAMLRVPAFGRLFGGASGTLGVVGLWGGAWTAVVFNVPGLIGSGRALGIGLDLPLQAPVVANLVFVFLLGAKVYSLSRAAST